MKRIVLAVLIAMMSLTSFAQMIAKGSTAKKVLIVKKSESTQSRSAVIDFSNPPDPVKGSVVYGCIDENGDTTLMVYLPEVDIDLM